MSDTNAAIDLKKTYIELAKEHKIIIRTLEFIPGFITWATLLSPIWLGIFAPNIAMFFLTFLSIYWLYRALVYTFGIVVGIKRYSKEIKIDWLKKCKNLDFKKLPEPETLPKNFKALKHLILIPTVNESYEILFPTFEAIAKSNYPKENIYIAVSIEEKGKEIVEESIKKIKKKYNLKHLMTYTHPTNIPGEVTGVASPNRTWGAKHAVADLKKRNLNIDEFIFTTFDADTVIHKEFLARLSYEYLVNDKRLNKFFSTAVFLFNNNYWDVPPLMRIEATNVMLGTLSSWIVDESVRETFSCYSTALKTLIDANYWDVTLIDDSVFFWRAFFARNGDFKGKAFYVPVSIDAVQGETFLKAHISLYKQLVRWGWGSIVFPIAMYGFLKVKGIPRSAKLLWTFNKLERHLIWRTIAFLITFGFVILTSVSRAIRQSTAVYRLPQIISILLSSAILLFIPLTYFKAKLTKPLPKDWPLWKRVSVFLEGPLVMINLLTYSFIPFLEAETKMMLGKKFKKTYYTPKIR